MADRFAFGRERYNLAQFDLSNMIRLGKRLRIIGEQSGCMEDAAERVVQYLRDSLVEEGEEKPCCALVRCFKTHPLGALPAEAAEAALASLQGAEPAPETPCLTLLATRGEAPEWNSRKSSQGHRAIPLQSADVIERAPMIAQLIQQMGLRPGDVIHPSADFLLDAEQRAFNVFHVPQAKGSQYVPAQGFVEAYGIRSVLGFGGLMPSGELFAVILFSRAPISREVADMFRTIALSTKLVLLPFTRGPVFCEEMGREETGKVLPQTNAAAQERQRAEIATLQLLIPALEDVALQQTEKLKRAVREAQQRTEEVRHLNAVLERRVEERTAELMTTNEELKAFSFSVSHDLRAPLRTIDGFSAALQEDYAPLLDEAGKNYLQRIQAGVRQMNVLIDAMMRLSRVTRAELVRSTVALSAAAEVVAAELREREPSRKVQFHIQPGLTIVADAHLVRVLLENLLGNAFKFTSRKPEAVINLGWSEEQKAFFVEDNGAGFDMQYVDKLFLTFSRLHNAAEFEGSGVGLATVARIMKRHGGSLWATGVAGEGATFWFRFD